VQVGHRPSRLDAGVSKKQTMREGGHPHKSIEKLVDVREQGPTKGKKKSDSVKLGEYKVFRQKGGALVPD